MNDLKFALRQLFKNSGFTAVAVLTLALGIGANTSMFSVLNAILYRPLPFHDSDRLVRVFRTSPQSRSWPHSGPNFLDHREQNRVFERMAAYSWQTYSLSERGEPAERLRGLTAMADFFLTLDVHPTLGRLFTAEEEKEGADHVVVLTDSFWRHRFGADTNIIGRNVQLDAQSVTIIGVLPASVECPSLWGGIDVWRPLVLQTERRGRGNNWLQSLARLKPGISLAQAQTDMNGVARRLAQANPGTNTDQGVRVTWLRDSTSDDTSRRLLWFTFGLTAFVLLIACANIANLQLVRASGRGREFAVRAALGAGRARLISQLLTESIVLSLLGAGFGLLLAIWGNEFIGKHIVLNNEPGLTIALDMRVLGFALGSALLTGLVFGMAPACCAARTNVNDSLKDGVRGATVGGSQHRFRRALIVGEVALALILLTGAGLFIRGLDRFLHRHPGWRVDGLVIAYMNLPETKYGNAAAQAAFFGKLEQRLAEIPGIQNAAICWDMPIWAFGSSRSMALQDRPEPPLGHEPLFYIDAVTPGFFETMGIRLQKGRVFTRADTTNSPDVVVINEAIARQFWPNQDPVGKRIGGSGASKDPNPEWQEVIGVVRDVRFPANPGEPDTRLQIYRPLAQDPRRFVAISLRTGASAESLAPVLRRAVAELDAGVPLHEVTTARAAVNRVMANASLLGTLLGAFALLGLVLAAVGIYGVISYSSAQRTREMGIRLALGAQINDVLWLVLREGLGLSAIGIFVGLAGAFVVARLLLASVPELPGDDFLTWVGVIFALVTVASLACWLPARRATKVDPMEALRYE